MNGLEKVKGNPLDWLLEPEDAGVRYLAMRDLLELDAEDPQMKAAQEAAYRTGPIGNILDAMDPQGYWAEPGPGYYPKYRSTVWTLSLLAQLGANIDSDARIARGCQYLLDHGLTGFGQFSASGSPGGTADCLQGNLCEAMLDLGVQDPRLELAFDWMARSVTGKGIAPKTDRDAPLRYYAGKCGPLFACGSNMDQPCAWGGVKVMLAFGKLPRNRWTANIQGAAQAGIDFFLGVDPASAGYPSPMAAKPSRNWWKFGFPVFYVTDLLQLVEALGRLGYGKDKRLENAYELMVCKQDEKGRWPLEYDYTGKTWVDFGVKKHPNKWVTLRALRAIRLRETI